VTNPDANSDSDPSDLDASAVSCTAPAERRPIAVLSGEIIGFPFSASDTDPEELLEPMAALHRDCSEVIGQYDGFLAIFLAKRSSRISAIQRHTRMMPSGRYEPV